MELQVSKLPKKNWDISDFVFFRWRQAKLATYVASSPGPAGPGSHKDTAKRFRFVTKTSWGMSLEALQTQHTKTGKNQTSQQSGKGWN